MVFAIALFFSALFSQRKHIKSMRYPEKKRHNLIFIKSMCTFATILFLNYKLNYRSVFFVNY